MSSWSNDRWDLVYNIPHQGVMHRDRNDGTWWFQVHLRGPFHDEQEAKEALKNLSGSARSAPRQGNVPPIAGEEK